jgi:OMF family outer membrane factor|nr:TolC family protein [Kofleriaceae bacterium]
MRHCLVIVAVLATAVSARADSAPRKLTFESAIQVALGQNPDIAIAHDKVESAQTKVDETHGHELPNVHAEFEFHYYKDPYSLAFGSLGTFTLYEQRTTTTVVSVTQPLTGLAYLSELVGASEHGVNAAKADYDKTRLEVAYKTAEAYVKVLEARAAADVAHASVNDIASELDRAEKLRAADTYTDIDVLRFKSAKAAADQAANRADASAQSTLAALVVQLGMHDGDVVDVADDLPSPAPALAVTVDGAQQRAISARPELRAAAERIAAADNTRTSTRETYVPDVRAVGEWIHLTGTQPFQPGDAYFLGVTASWNVFDWGATHAKVVAAEHEQEAASIAASSLAEHVRLDVRTHWLDATADYANLASAQTQVQTAEEAMRLQRVRFDAGAATVTDVLDAQTDVARGRLQAANARYDYYLGLVALARAMGDLPKP